ncbi:MAG: Dyp-type peroxidase [Bacteroidia bacterium]|nr:Dyp-type peroxidase [Bacteroidia bacterium]
MNPKVELELEDIQGFIIRGYKRMNFSRYCLLQINDIEKAKKWISDTAFKVTTCVNHEEVNCINLAIGYPGFVKLGLHGNNLDNFSTEFRVGMADPHTSRILGDFGSSDPSNWNWGGTHNPQVDMMLMLFGNTQESLDAFYNIQLPILEAHNISILHHLDGQTLPENKEHFGFRDGISQPTIKGSGRSGPSNDIIEPGEFVLGYLNEYGVYPESPLIEEPQGNLNLLPEDSDLSGYKDLGRNGSYLVFRQIEQLVDKFWSFMLEKTASEKEAIKLASKMVGRWPSGAPLVKFPDEDPGGISDDDEFGYYKEDPDGLKCPFGSHLRRNNPRDKFEDNGPKKSLQITKRHRIMRRARLYGEPYVGSPQNHKPAGEVGLQFVCFQANIGKQFEFLQHTWANYPNFDELYNDPDPIIGTMEKPYVGYEQNFTIQGCPVSKSVKGLEPFTRIKGGAYFFLPGITALRYLATL